LFTCIKIIRPGGVKAMAAENMALRQQLIVPAAPDLTFSDRLSFAFLAGILSPSQILKSAILIKPSTLLKLHKALIKRKYRLLFSRKTKMKPGPAGPSSEIIAAVVAMKRRNPRFGCRRIAMQVSHTFGVDVDKD
jgi:putative transposase